MLLYVSVSNYKSFDEKAELSLISSSKMQGNKDHRVKIKQTGVLKYAAVYGANASGKSNLIKAVSFVKRTLLEGLSMDSCFDFCKTRAENERKESTFELRFTSGDKFYAYGFSAILNERKVTEEWLYELHQDGSSRPLFLREGEEAPKLGEGLVLSAHERNRFEVYASDFSTRPSRLFLSEMNRGKKYEQDSKLLFFKNAFEQIINHIIVLTPNMSLSNTDVYYDEASLERISNLIRTFDTGVSEIKTRKISPEEMGRVVPKEMLSLMMDALRKQMQMSNLPELRMSWRMDNAFFALRLKQGEEAEVTTLVLKHGESLFDFSFGEESDGTKRLFDLIDMLLDKREDLTYVVDELERSLHPKLTERFLKLFMEDHASDRDQLIFATHEDSIMDQELFRRDEIYFVEKEVSGGSKIYSLDRFKERYDKKLGKAYLEGRYGAIPVFKEFAFRKEG